MTTKIRILNDLTINKIAAGEVIENPASVVKELVENALDAGATDICIEIKEGGRQLIRVSDNGCGMSQDDALLCLERHATSKIREVEELQELHTMGFRGEAIPSIAAISKFTLLTCPHLAEMTGHTGTLIMVDGGRLISCTPAACAPGTSIEIKSLFFNVPVRKKFQRSPSYDTQEILKLVSILSLGHPHIKFELISDQKPLLKTSLLPPDHTFSEQLASRIESVLGKHFMASSYPVSFHKEPYFLEGYVGLPSYTRPNRTGQYLFINQRAVQSPLIGYAVKAGYGPMLAPNRHPVYVLHLKMPGSLVDINVHPQKKEVRLRQEHHLKEAVIQAVQATLQKEGFADSYTFDMPEIESVLEEPKVEYKTDSFTFKEEMSIPATWSPLIKQRPLTQDLEKPQELLLQAPIKKSQAPRVVATLANFILVDPSSFNKSQALCLVDQKAAHARIHYERLLKKLVENGSENNYIQPLLIPQHWEFSSLEAVLMREYGESLAKMGFGIRDMGQNTFLIDAVPDVFDKVDAKEIITNILQGIYEEQDTKQFQREKEKSLLMAACKASTRAVNQQMSREEAQLVIDQLFNCETPFICPSGNPTWVCLTSEDLLNFFQKKLI